MSGKNKNNKSNNNRNKNKYKKILIIVFMIILVIILILSNILKTKKKELKEDIKAQQEIKDDQEFTKQYLDKRILPRNIYELYNYDGSYDRDDLYTNMNVFTEYISYLSKNVSENESEEFYEEHDQEILENLGITEKDIFVEFIKDIQDKNVDIKDFKYAEVEEGSSTSDEDFYYFNLNLYYGEKEEQVPFYVAFSKKRNNQIMVYYEFR